MAREKKADELKMELQLRANVMKMAGGIPMDSPISELAVALIATMGKRKDNEKLILMATALVAALKMIAEREAADQP